jgi:hypothetical protein
MSQALGWAAVKSSDLKLFRTLKDFLYVLIDHRKVYFC